MEFSNLLLLEGVELKLPLYVKIEIYFKIEQVSG